MKKNINQILDKKNNIKIYSLSSLLLFSFFLRLITVYFIRDTHFDNEWNILLDNFIEYKSYSFHNFNGELVPSALLPPMYPFFLYSLKVLTTFDKPNLLYSVIFVQIILSTYSVYLFYKICLSFFSDNISIINSIIFSIIPLNVIICGQISSACLQIFFSLLFLKFLLLIINKGTKKNIFFLSLVSGFLVLLRGEFLLIFPFIIFFVFIKKKISFNNFVMSLIIVALTISPYVIRNYIHFNQIFVVKSLGYNLWKGNNQLSKVGGYETLENIKFTELKNKIDNLEKDKFYEIKRDDIFLSQALNNLKEEPIHYFYLFFKKLISYYFIDINSNYKNYYNFFHIYPITLLSLLSFPGLFLFYKVNKFENKCFVLYLFLNLIIFSIFFILPRYKLAILPIQIILAAYFINYLVKKINLLYKR